MDWFNSMHSAADLRKMFVEYFRTVYGFEPRLSPDMNRCTFAAGLEKLSALQDKQLG